MLINLRHTMTKVPVWFLGDHCYWPATVTVMQHNNSLGKKWPDSTCLSSRWPSIMPALSCREGRFSFFCWHWRSGHWDGGTQNVMVVFFCCGFGSALLGFANFFPTVLTTFSWRPQSGSSGACHSGKKTFIFTVQASACTYPYMKSYVMHPRAWKP